MANKQNEPIQPKPEQGCPDLGLLHACHDGELSPSQSQTIQNHIKQCARCQQVYQQLQQTSRLIQTTTAPVPPANLLWDVQKLVGQQTAQPQNHRDNNSCWQSVIDHVSRGWWKIPLAAAVAVLALLVVPFSLSNTQPTGYEIVLTSATSFAGIDLEFSFPNQSQIVQTTQVIPHLEENPFLVKTNSNDNQFRLSMAAPQELVLGSGDVLLHMSLQDQKALRRQTQAVSLTSLRAYDENGQPVELALEIRPVISTSKRNPNPTA